MRYRASVLGLGWSYVKPAVQFAVYFVGIGLVLRQSAIGDYAIYLFGGLVVVTTLSEAVGNATRSVVANGDLVRKIFLPRELFPVASGCVAAVHLVPQLLVLVVAALACGWRPDAVGLLALVTGLALVAVLSLGLGLLLSALNVLYPRPSRTSSTCSPCSCGPARSFPGVVVTSRCDSWLFRSSTRSVAVELSTAARGHGLPGTSPAAPDLLPRAVFARRGLLSSRPVRLPAVSGSSRRSSDRMAHVAVSVERLQAFRLRHPLPQESVVGGPTPPARGLRRPGPAGPQIGGGRWPPRRNGPGRPCSTLAGVCPRTPAGRVGGAGRAARGGAVPPASRRERPPPRRSSACARAGRDASRVVEFADIGPFLDTQVRFYSSGMFLRLAFAVAVHTDPDVFLVDEILAVGDEASATCLRASAAVRGAALVVVARLPLMERLASAGGLASGAGRRRSGPEAWRPRVALDVVGRVPTLGVALVLLRPARSSSGGGVRGLLGCPRPVCPLLSSRPRDRARSRDAVRLVPVLGPWRCGRWSLRAGRGATACGRRGIRPGVPPCAVRGAVVAGLVGPRRRRRLVVGVAAVGARPLAADLRCRLPPSARPRVDRDARPTLGPLARAPRFSRGVADLVSLSARRGPVPCARRGPRAVRWLALGCVALAASRGP